jgi:hypothetical protein
MAIEECPRLRASFRPPSSSDSMVQLRQRKSRCSLRTAAAERRTTPLQSRPQSNWLFSSPKSGSR